MNLLKGSCCSTWVPRQINMEFPKELRKNFLIREEWPFPDRGEREREREIYIYIQIIEI